MTHREAVDTLASERYLLDEMSEVERFAFEEHFFTCHECADDVRAGEKMRQHVKSAFAGGRASQPASTIVKMPDRAWPRWRPQVVLPWACAATVTLLFGYESLLVVPELRKTASPQALAPVLLHPASRGTDPIITLSADQPFTALAADVNTPSAGHVLAYELTTEAGSTIVSGSTTQPPAGTPLLLMIPSRQLSAGTHYRLVLHDAASSSSTLGEYRFVAVAER